MRVERVSRESCSITLNYQVPASRVLMRADFVAFSLYSDFIVVKTFFHASKMLLYRLKYCECICLSWLGVTVIHENCTVLRMGWYVRQSERRCLDLTSYGTLGSCGKASSIGNRMVLQTAKCPVHLSMASLYIKFNTFWGKNNALEFPKATPCFNVLDNLFTGLWKYEYDCQFDFVSRSWFC
jgi:hypothetical protein